MKSISLLVLACLVSAPVLAQTLPDEINYGPYESRFRTLEESTAQAQNELQAARTKLAESQRYIEEMGPYLQGLEEKVRRARAEIEQNQRAIPALQSEITRLRSEQVRLDDLLRQNQMNERQITQRYEKELHDLRPMENNLENRERIFRNHMDELQALKKIETDANNRFAGLQIQISNLDKQIEQERSAQRQMKSDLQNIETRINAATAEVTRLENQKPVMVQTIAVERGNLATIDKSIEELKLQASQPTGNPRDQMVLLRKIQLLEKNREALVNKIVDLEKGLANMDSTIQAARNRIDAIRGESNSLPARIAQSEAREAQLSGERNSKAPELGRLQAEAQTAQRAADAKERVVQGVRNEVENQKVIVLKQRATVDFLAKQLEGVREELRAVTIRHRDINVEVAKIVGQLQAIDQRMPVLGNIIRDGENEIRTANSDLVRARNDERVLAQNMANLEARLNDVVADRDEARSQMEQRISQYNNYLQDAQELGAGQAKNATDLGVREGEKLSTTLSRQNGQSMGRDLGASEARYWALTRGEVTGFEQGYSEGMNSVEDRTRGQREGESKGVLDAQQFAQVNFKPQFFEEFLIEEFKKPLVQRVLVQNILSPLKAAKMMSVERVEERQDVQPLSPNEISRSQELRTSLDASINNGRQDVKNLEAKALALNDANTAFQKPTKIPYGAVNCSQVYKNLAVFKAACDSSYKETFASSFTSGAKRGFLTTYSQNYTSILNEIQVSQREATYPTELASSFKIARGEGLSKGKIDIFDQTYATTYRSSYDFELPRAKDKAKTDASEELKKFVATKAALTISETSLSASDFRGGEEVQVQAEIKNISSVAYNGPVLFRITQIENAEILQGEVTSNSAPGLSITELPSLKVKILSTARAGQKVVVRGVVDLPGDLYKNQRQERFELTQVLSANPSNNTELEFDKSPSIKGLFSTNKHTFSAKITANVEDIQQGFEVTLKAVGANASQIQQKETSAKTGELKLNKEKVVKFTYTFPKSAKGKVVQLEMTVSYAGKVLKKELIELAPH